MIDDILFSGLGLCGMGRDELGYNISEKIKDYYLCQKKAISSYSLLLFRYLQVTTI